MNKTILSLFLFSDVKSALHMQSSNIARFDRATPNCSSKQHEAMPLTFFLLQGKEIQRRDMDFFDGKDDSNPTKDRQ